MKTPLIRHGEVILKEIASLPIEATLQTETKKHIVAHSETGHHHVLESIDNYKVYTWNGETYIELGSVGTLFHEKTGAYVHKPHKIAPSVYKIVIKKEFDYFAGAVRKVRD